MRPVEAYTVTGILLVLAVAGCGNGGQDSGPCGTFDGQEVICGPRMHCDRSGAEPVCVCDKGYTGLECDQCDRGYEQVGEGEDFSCKPIPVDCDADPWICDPGGDCVDDACVCIPAHTGRLCEECSGGYQDNDGNGLCEPDCETMGLTCVGRRVCSDASGVAQCECVEGYEGESCSQCAAGYRDVAGDGVCIPTCAVVQPDCSGHGQCDDRSGYPKCLCDIGYVADDCSECAGTHAMTAEGECQAEPDPARHLVAAAVDPDGRPVLGVVDYLESWSFLPLAMLEDEVAGLAYDPAGQTLWGLVKEYPERLVTIDIRTGAFTDVQDLDNYHSLAGPVFDPVRQQIYLTASIGAPNYFLTYDIAEDRLYQEGGSLGGGEGKGMTFDEAGDRILGVTGMYGGEESRCFEVAMPPPGSLEWGPDLGTNRGLGAVGISPGPGTDELFLAGQLTASRDEWLFEACREISALLGHDMTDAPTFGGYTHITGEAQEIVLSGDAGPEAPLVAYGSYGDFDAPPLPARIRVAHPHAVACIMTYEEKLTVVLEAGTRLRYLILGAYRPSLTLEVEPGFTPEDDQPPVRVWFMDDAGADPSITGQPDLVSFNQVGIHVPPYYDGERYQRPVFCAMEWESGAAVCRDVPGYRFTGGLASLGGTK